MKNNVQILLASLDEMPKSKVVIEDIVHGFDTGKYEVKDVMDLYFSRDLRLCHYSGWLVQLLAEHRPDRLYPFISELVENLKEPFHDAILRNTYRAFQFIPVSPEFEGTLYDLAFEHLTNPKTAIAIKVFSMTVCRKIAMGYPELIPELILEIEEAVKYGSAGFRNRASKEIKILQDK